MPLIEIEGLDVLPEGVTAIDAPVSIAITFKTDEGLVDAQWSVTYVVDTASKRHVIELGTESGLAYEAGTHTYEFKAESVSVQGVKRKHHLNVGMIVASLQAGGTELVDVKLIVQVTRSDEDKKQLNRLILNPMAT